MVNLHKYVLEQDDPYEFIYEAISGTHGLEAQEALTELYSDIAVDYFLHPDDDFEKIIDYMLHYMEVV